MESPEQARAYADADFSAPHDAFVAAFRERFPDFGGGTAVDLGCGAADIAVRFARAHPAASVHGVDGSAAMLELGAAHVEASGLADRITLQLARLPVAEPRATLGRPVRRGDHQQPAAPPRGPDGAVAHRGGGGGPGAPVFVMDLRRPASTDVADALVATYAAGEHPLLQDDFRASLCAAYTVGEVAAQVEAAGLPLRVEALGDRHLLVWGHLR